eukprot:SAG11_NODE_980_length_6319_cov_2.389068_1_plen_242_part_00
MIRTLVQSLRPASACLDASAAVGEAVPEPEPEPEAVGLEAEPEPEGVDQALSAEAALATIAGLRAALELSDAKVQAAELRRHSAQEDARAAKVETSRAVGKAEEAVQGEVTALREELRSLRAQLVEAPPAVASAAEAARRVFALATESRNAATGAATGGSGGSGGSGRSRFGVGDFVKMVTADCEFHRKAAPQLAQLRTMWQTTCSKCGADAEEGMDAAQFVVAFEKMAVRLYKSVSAQTA